MLVNESRASQAVECFAPYVGNGGKDSEPVKETSPSIAETLKYLTKNVMQLENSIEKLAGSMRNDEVIERQVKEGAKEANPPLRVMLQVLGERLDSCNKQVDMLNHAVKRELGQCRLLG